MFTINPFAELAGVIPPIAMQIYVIVMAILVAGGTILDTLHKKSAQYFFENAEKARKAARRTVSGGEKMSLAISTVANEVLTPGMRLLQLQARHRALDTRITEMQSFPYQNQILLQRLKKEKLRLKDAIERLKDEMIPDLNA